MALLLRFLEYRPGEHSPEIGLLLTMTYVSKNCVVVISIVSEFYHVSWSYKTLVINLIGQLSPDIIGRLSIKLWCYWLWRLQMSNDQDRHGVLYKTRPLTLVRPAKTLARH